MDKQAITNYIENNKQRFLDELFDLLRLPSISADEKYAGDVRKTAVAVQERLIEAGCDNAELIETNGHPVVYGEKTIDPNLPTVVVYGHYDVQPADPIELWDSPPFEPVIRDEKIYARGACDDKGQMYMHVKALQTMIDTGTLPCNVKFMIEGEEEVGSKNLGTFVRENKEKLAGDVILISDTGILSNENPSICVGLRGLSYVEVEVTGPNRDLHSGLYGGSVANPINILSDMISSLIDDKGRITIPGFYDRVEELSAEERIAMNNAPFSDEDYKAELEITDVKGEEGFTTLERIGIRPALDVNGIWGGYIGEGAKTVLPAKAYAKISMRLVPDQQNEEITKLFTDHFMSLAPAGVKVKVIPHHGGQPAVTKTDSLAYKAASNAFEEAWGKEPIPTRDGGSIPIVALFKDVLKTDVVLLGFGLASDAIHSPNEHYGVFNYFKGIETITLFYKHFKALKN